MWRTRVALIGLAAVGLAATMGTGCRYNTEEPQTAFGASGVADPNEKGPTAENAIDRSEDIGGRGISDTWGTSVTGAAADAGSPQIGETGEVPVSSAPAGTPGPAPTNSPTASPPSSAPGSAPAAQNPAAKG